MVLYTTNNDYSMPNNVFKFQVKSVEVVWNDSLEKLYFPSGQESLIRRKVKDQLLWGLARKTLTDKNVDFLHWSEEVSCSKIYKNRAREMFGRKSKSLSALSILM